MLQAAFERLVYPVSDHDRRNNEVSSVGLADSAPEDAKGEECPEFIQHDLGQPVEFASKISLRLTGSKD
jgi:hypothetical protein